MCPAWRYLGSGPWLGNVQSGGSQEKSEGCQVFFPFLLRAVASDVVAAADQVQVVPVLVVDLVVDH